MFKTGHVHRCTGLWHSQYEKDAIGSDGSHMHEKIRIPDASGMLAIRTSVQQYFPHLWFPATALQRHIAFNSGGRMLLPHSSVCTDLTQSFTLKSHQIRFSFTVALAGTSAVWTLHSTWLIFCCQHKAVPMEKVLAIPRSPPCNPKYGVLSPKQALRKAVLRMHRLRSIIPLKACCAVGERSTTSNPLNVKIFVLWSQVSRCSLGGVRNHSFWREFLKSFIIPLMPPSMLPQRTLSFNYMKDTI